jgi:hypothetical protein
MSGLILAGIGKGIADAGQTFAQAGMRQYEMDRQDEREVLREERLLKRQEALDQLKLDREEAKLRKDADIYSQAEQNAPAIGDQRRFDKFKADVGQTDASEEELRNIFNESYNQKKVGNFEGADRYVERYSKQKEDVLNEIRRLGGSSSAIKEGRESYKATVDAEARADKDAIDRKRGEQQDRRLDLMEERITSQNKTDTIRANKPAGGSGGAGGSSKVRSTYTDDQGNKVAVMSDGSTKVLGRGMDFDKQVASLVSTMSKNDYAFGKLPEAEKRQKAIERLTGGTPAPRTGDNAGTRPPLSSFNR